MKNRLIIFALFVAVTLVVIAGDDTGVVTYSYNAHSGGTILVETESDELTFRVTAVPAPQYEFVRWFDGETANPRIYTHVDDESQDSTLQAIFACKNDVHKKDGHVVVDLLDWTIPSFSLTATPNEGASFRQWDDANTNVTISYVEQDGQKTAYFVNDLGNVSLFFEQHAGGIISSVPMNGLTFELTATPQNGYSFLMWTDGDTSNPKIYTHVQDESTDKTLHAVFTLNKDIQKEFGHIEVTISDDMQPSFDLTAVPNAGAQFVQWEDASSNPFFNNYVEATGNKSAYFLNTGGVASYQYDPHIGGNVEVTHISNLTYSILAIPSSGYSFLSWADGLTTNPRIYTQEADFTKDKTLRAVFTKDEDIVREGGNVQVTIANEATPSFNLNVQENSGYQFLMWNNGSSNTDMAYLESDGQRFPYFVNVLGSVSIYKIQHPGGVVDVEEQDELFTYSVSATPNNGYSFMSWSDGNTDNPRIYTHPQEEDGDATLHAVFTHTVDLAQLGGTTDVSITDADAPTFKLEAKESACASFLIWRDNETARERIYTEDDGTQIPIFTFGDHYMQNEVTNSEGGIIDVDTLTCGYTIKAIPASGYYFAEWEDQSTNPLRDVDYIESTYNAYFAKAAFKVGDIYYGSFEQAQNEASLDNPIMLVSDVLSDIVVNKPIAIDGKNYHVNNLIINCGASVELKSALTVNNLFLNATTGSSAQFKKHELLSCTNAYIDIKLEANNSVASPDKWYAISVPFEVDIENGIARANGVGTHISNTDYLVWGYDGDLRSLTGNGWEIMLGGTMYPGKFYMIGIDGSENVWRFTKKAGTDLCGSNEMILPAYPGSAIDGGWNALGNSILEYVNVSISNVPFVQVYDNANSRYIPKLTNSTTFVVGAPFFAQVAAEESLHLTPDSEASGALYSPQRSNDNLNYVEVRLAKDDMYDAIFVAATDDAKNYYEIGKDLAKLSFVYTIPQIYMVNYGTMLCAQNAILQNGVADVPLYMYVPADGMYELSASFCQDVTLLCQGQPIANLAMGAYSLQLSKGMNTSYMLRLGEKYISTDNSTITPLEQTAQKILVNDHLYIIQSGCTFDVLGKRVY